MKRIKENVWTLIAAAVLSTVLLWAAAGMKAIYQNFDGPFYIVVAKAWYNKDFIRNNFSFALPLEYYPAHFPLYPALIDLITIFRINHLQAMVVVNLLVSVAGVAALYKIAEKLKWEHPFWIAFTWLFWWPRMLAVRSIGSPETLFVLTIISSLYFFEKKKYWLSGICGSLAMLTKSPGILLLLAYGIWLLVNYIKTKKLEFKIWPVLLIGLTALGLFSFFYLKTGDFMAYFHTGDNIHLQLLPFKVFDSSQTWVGSIWLEDIIWVYLIGGIGVYRALKKNLIWGIFGAVFYATILFVSHRDISRYSLPIVPVVLMGLSEIFAKKEIRWFLVLAIIPIFFYTLNFVMGNTLSIADWGPFL
jgi:Gpi18-like mannosyltransferase